MHYQVVARSAAADVDGISTNWEYYPYWAPGRDRAAAERLAVYAAQNGREAAILQGRSVELLETIARQIVERQEVQRMPALRYLPGAAVARTDGWIEHEVETILSLSPDLDLYDEGPVKCELDQRRLELELGDGGDITRGSGQRFASVHIPQRMDLLSAWLRLRERIENGQLGGSEDGAVA
ncbi:MAG TPA: hypothetical protein VIG30_00955 [Ktedonobacterales bacterium]